MLVPEHTPGLARILAVNPVHRPSARLTAAAARAGALGVLELPETDAGAVLDQAARWAARPFGVRVRPGCTVAADDLPALAQTVVLADPDRSPAEFPGREVLVEVGDLDQARAAIGAAGLIARGAESGGRVGSLATFVLLQRLLAEVDLPVWACGGIGPRTAAAAVAGGAAGVVLDTQLALLPEAGLPAEITDLLTGLDGSETVLRDGFRVLRRRDVELPAGQDAFLAERFAARWRTVAAVVRGIEAEIDSVGPSAVRILGRRSAGSAALGTPLGVAQGPMTRVSDQPEFAAAVAREGALPFLALALATADQTRSMLTRARDALGHMPWGVGILGFADEQVRSAQLEVVREIKPTHAIIAGGKPGQAAALEAEGISTFLHVPSPGLLKQFLGAGARKFVFEGAECGGHVGPRNSFPLWEAQLDVLLEHGADGVTVLFAGGVHDERSAAMVAALAAPLAEAGAAVGVLMGTAYLFTEEAVAAGAIQPLFQRQVVDADRTDLLETAPGHATRCVHSAFTADFAATKDRLKTEGVADRDAWEELEQLNIGRLRLASKGIERVGADLRPVAEDRQAAEGMFMAGEVAVLRDRVTTLAELHHSVGDGAAEWLAARVAPEPTEAAEPNPLRIAIVGMAGMFPGAPDLASFWANVVSAKDSVTEVPAQRWDKDLYYAEGGDGERTPSRWGGFLPQIDFDPLAYGIPPSSLVSIEPVQLLALEAARRALADAGLADADHARTSVVFGAEAGSDLSNATSLRTVLPSYVGEIPAELDAQLPKLTEDSFPGMLANVIAGRIANRLDLGGANYTVDAACASSLTAVDVACKELTAGTSDLVVCGGADLHNGINDYLLFSSVHALSPSGRSATFDSSGDGIALGEGVACVVLKRLADAERDGDRVYAVIDGVGAASDGRALGLTAPRPEGQRAALTRAYAMAGVSPAEVGLVEAHGTGTVVGDRTELAVLTEVFTESGAQPGQCALGSVKSQIGHTKCAAGLAGLIKTTLALHHGVRPPTLHLKEPNPAWDAGTSPFAFHTAARPWAGEDRVAGVSAFGFGGTNFHVVLRAYDAPPSAHALDEWPAELFVLRGTDAVKSLLDEVERGGWRLRDHARGAARRSDVAAARGIPVHAAIVAKDLDELRKSLRCALTGESTPGLYLADQTELGQLAFLFPGQGSQRPGMLADLFVAFPELQHYLRLGAQWADAVHPPAAFDEQAKAAQLARITDTRVAQPALGIAGLAAADLLVGLGVKPDLAAGHSYGELVALAVAGVFTPADLLTASAARAEAILDQVRDGDPGTMAAVTASPTEIEAVLAEAGLAEHVVTANRNSPTQTVVSGPTDAVATAVGCLRDNGFTVRPVQVACAFHSALVAGAGETFGTTLADLPLRAPRIPVWSNRTAAAYPAEPDAVRAELAAQLGAPVRFADEIEGMYAAGARTFVETGPGRVLSRLVGAVLGDRPHRVITVDGGVPGFLTAVAQLAVAGVDLRIGRLFQGRDAADPTGRQAPKRPGWTVDGQLVRRADGEAMAGGLHPARRVALAGAPHAIPESQGDGEALVTEFLRSSREMVNAQRDVLLRYFGAAPPVALPEPPPVVEALPIEVVPEPVAPQSESVLDAVLAVVAERTGYPVDMIDPGLDLEADLSVDSIKRAEIAGELASRLGLPVDGDLDEVSTARTAQAIAALIESRLGEPAAPAPANVLTEVLAVVAERTGYPVDMIDPGLDLEADLSVDSIKRAEIAGELASRLGLPLDGDLDDVSSARTAQAIAELIESRLGTPAAPAPKNVLTEVLAVVAERTGYPVDMIDPGLDLEADLSVDSIKRAEIAGELASRLGLPVDGDLDDVSTARTATAIAELIESRLSGGPVAPAEPVAEDGLEIIAPRRLEFVETELAATGALLRGTVHLVGEHPVADLLAERVAVQRHPSGHVPAGGAVVLLDALDPPETPLPEAFPWFKAVLSSGPTHLIAVERRSASGLRGFFRTVAREYPDTAARIVEVGAATPAEIADALLVELGVQDREPVVLHQNGTRRGLTVQPADLGPLAATGAGPAGDGVAEAMATGLDRDAVVLLVGGAKGITARFAATLAAAGRPRLELVGRTPVPGDEEGPAGTRDELRKHFIAQGGLKPAEIEKAVRGVLAEREVRATLSKLQELGSEVRYHCVDVLDDEAMRTTIKDIHAERGRLDGVVYAAGVIEDKLIADKSVESFRRVFATKVDGARTLLDAIDGLPNGPRFAVLFGSIAGALGNRGQCDYAAANDALEELGRLWSTPDRRGLTVHWGPWAGGGMVSPELMRSYAARGIKLIDPDEGPASLLRELAWGPRETNAVIYTASGW